MKNLTFDTKAYDNIRRCRPAGVAQWRFAVTVILMNGATVMDVMTTPKLPYGDAKLLIRGRIRDITEKRGKLACGVALVLPS